MDFVSQLKRKILRLKNQFSSEQISQQVKLPINIVEYILKQQDNQQQQVSQQPKSLTELNPKQAIQNPNLPKTNPISQHLFSDTLKKKRKKDKSIKEQQVSVKEMPRKIVKIDQSNQQSNNQIIKEPSNSKQEKLTKQQKPPKQNLAKKIIMIPKEQIYSQNDTQINSSQSKEPQKLNKESNPRKLTFEIQDNQEIIRLTKSGIVIQTENQKELFICFYCNKSYQDSILLSKHFIRNHPNQNQLLLFCPLCQNITFENFPQYYHHIKQHQDIKYTLSQVKEFQQQNIKKQIFQSAELSQVNSQVNYFARLQGKAKADKYFPTNINDGYSSDESQLLIQSQKYECLECQQPFENKDQLDLHQKKLHSSKNKNYTLVTDKTLQELEKENPTTQYGTIIRDKNDNALYQCKECKAIFNKSRSLQKHFKKKHPQAEQNIVKCLVCETLFEKRQHLLKHLTRHKKKEQTKEISREQEGLICQKLNNNSEDISKLQEHLKQNHQEQNQQLGKQVENKVEENQQKQSEINQIETNQQIIIISDDENPSQSNVNQQNQQQVQSEGNELQNQEVKQGELKREQKRKKKQEKVQKKNIIYQGKYIGDEQMRKVSIQEFENDYMFQQNRMIMMQKSQNQGVQIQQKEMNQQQQYIYYPYFIPNER